MPFLAGPGGLGGIGGWAAGPVGFGISIISEILGALFGGIFGGGGVGQVEAQVHQLRDQMSKAVDLLKRFEWHTAFALGTLLQAFHDFWVGFLDKLWSLLRKIAHAIARLVTEVLPRLLEWMNKIQKRLDELYAKYVRPLLDYIQKIRKYLAILRAFHIKWAAKLDDELVKIEGDIIRPYLAVRRWLGALGGYVNVILTRTGVIQRALLLNSMYAWAADWVNLWYVAQSGQLNDTAAVQGNAEPQPDDIGTVKAKMLEALFTGAGEYAKDQETARDAARSVMV